MQILGEKEIKTIIKYEIVGWGGILELIKKYFENYLQLN